MVRPTTDKNKKRKAAMSSLRKQTGGGGGNNKAKDPKPNKAQPPKKKSGGGGDKGKPNVQRLATSVIRPQVRSLKSQRNQVERDYTTGMSDLERLLTTANADVDYVSGETGDYLSSLRSKTADEGAAARDRSVVAAEALRARLGDTYSGAQNNAMAELQRLGIAGGGNFSGLQADAANASYMADQSSANALSTLDVGNANADSIMGILEGMNQGSRLSGRLNNQRAYNDSVRNLQNNRMDALSKLQDAITETKKSRKDLVIQLLGQYGKSGWKRLLK